MFYNEAFAIVYSVLNNKEGHKARFDQPESIILAGQSLKQAWVFRHTIAETFFKVMAVFYTGSMIVPISYLYSDQVHELEQVFNEGGKTPFIDKLEESEGSAIVERFTKALEEIG